MDQTNLDLLLDELTMDEGSSPTVYFDNAKPVSNPTIGCGHNLNASPLPAGWIPPLTPAQIRQLLTMDVQTKAIDPLNKFLPWWNTLDDVRQRVLANMAFNMGVGSLLQFKQMLTYLQNRNFITAATCMVDSVWYNEVGQRAVRLCQAMEEGKMPS